MKKIFTYFLITLTMSLLSTFSAHAEKVVCEGPAVNTSVQGQNIVIQGKWGERQILVMLWQEGGVSGFNTYSPDLYSAQLTNPYAEWTATSNGVYTDKGDGGFLFEGTFTDGTTTYELTMTNVETYNNEYVVQDLLITVNGESSTTFQGSADYINFDFTIFAVGYGTHEIEGFIGQMKATGTAVFSYSEEYKSDLLVASLNVPAMGWKVKVTMYTLFIEPTDTIVCEGMKKTISTSGWSPVLILRGTHATYGSLSFSIQGCDGSYNKYPTIVGSVGDMEVMGNGTWANDGENDLLEAILSNEDTTKVYKVFAYTKAEAQTKPTELIVNDAIFADEEGMLTINGTSIDGKLLNLELIGFSEIGYGTYPTHALSGKIDDVDVANIQKTAFLSIDETEVVLDAEVIDAQGNIYLLEIYGVSPTAQQTIHVVASNLTTSVKYGTYLQLDATTEDGKKISLWLYDGVNKGYGDYGYDGEYADVESAKYADISLTLSKEIVAKYYQLGDIDVFEGTFIGSDNNIYILKLSSKKLTSSVDELGISNLVKKVVENGQIMIVRNGMKYNLVGAIIK